MESKVPPPSQDLSAQGPELHSLLIPVPGPSLSARRDLQEDLREGERIIATAEKNIVIVDTETNKPVAAVSFSVQEIAGPETPAIGTGTPAHAMLETTTFPGVSPKPIANKVSEFGI
jgi:hypothetical protein